MPGCREGHEGRNTGARQVRVTYEEIVLSIVIQPMYATPLMALRMVPLGAETIFKFVCFKATHDMCHDCGCHMSCDKRHWFLLVFRVMVVPLLSPFQAQPLRAMYLKRFRIVFGTTAGLFRACTCILEERQDLSCKPYSVIELRRSPLI